MRPCTPAAVSGVKTYATAVTITNAPSARRIGSPPRQIAYTATPSIPRSVAGHRVPNDSWSPGANQFVHTLVSFQ